MSKDVLLYEVKEQIAYLTLNNPKRNLLDPDLCKALGKAWSHFADDPESRVAILSANGPDFSFGADLRYSGLLDDLRKAFPQNGTKILKPIVGAVHGTVAGSGFGLATYGTDIIYATEDTSFIFGEAWVGIVGSVMEYAPYMPFKIALEFYLTGQPMSGRRAYEVGFVNHVVKDRDELMTEAVKMAETLRDNAPLTLRTIKYGHYKNMESASRKAMRLAQEEFAAFIQPQLESEDFKEGFAALKENRKPIFKGR
ncbi:MAG: enoyl-CoA hydratase/isomerase family protein [Deltaproteobacteria bacterium]|nr:enoyl-CoA hydratase/isomerase family protein [Deltaproteobacteria bacterium]